MAAFILRVKETLNKRGWIKGRSENAMGQVCLSQAFEITNGQVTSEVKSAARARLQNAIKAQRPQTSGDIVSFNDSGATQRQDVDKVLDQAASL